MIWKNPLGVIYGMSILILDEPCIDEETKDMLEIIKASSETMNHLITDLLTTKRDKGSQELPYESVNLRELLADSISLLRYRAREKHQRLLFEKIPFFTIEVKRERIWRVLNNLIVNAIKFSPAHSNITISAQAVDNHMVKVSVKDKEIGIPGELQAKGFDFTSDAKRQGTAGEDSYGLRLYTSKNIVQEHGGRIWFESKVNEGTIFHFTLPILQKGKVI